jgi:hypothetical protein
LRISRIGMQAPVRQLSDGVAEEKYEFGRRSSAPQTPALTYSSAWSSRSKNT